MITPSPDVGTVVETIFQKMDFEAARQQLDTLLEKDASNAFLYWLQGETWLAQGKPQMAKESYERGLKHHKRPEEGVLLNYSLGSACADIDGVFKTDTDPSLPFFNLGGDPSRFHTYREKAREILGGSGPEVFRAIAFESVQPNTVHYFLLQHHKIRQDSQPAIQS